MSIPVVSNSLFGGYVNRLLRFVVTFALQISFSVWFALVCTWLLRRSFVPLRTEFSVPVYFERIIPDTTTHYLEANATLLSHRGREIFDRGVPYLIELQLTLPETPVNRDAGLVPFRLTVLELSGKQLAHAYKTIIIKYRSALLRWIRCVLFLPLFLCGFLDETQTHSVVFIESFYDSALQPAVLARLQTDCHQLQVESAVLHISARLFGFSYLLHTYPLTTTALLFAACLALLCALLSCYWFSKGYSSTFGKTSTTIPALKQKQLPTAATGNTVTKCGSYTYVNDNDPVKLPDILDIQQRYVQRLQNGCANNNAPAPSELEPLEKEKALRKRR